MTYYLCDTENIQRAWAPYAMKAEAGDAFLLFYSRNVGTVSMGLFGPACVRGVRFEFIECHTGPNAMDFQLATELGRMVSEHKDASFVILSRDGGFDVVVDYWHSRGVSVRRVGPPSNATSVPPPVENGTEIPIVPDEELYDEDRASVETAKGQDAGMSVHDVYVSKLDGQGLTPQDLRVVVGVFTAAMRNPKSARLIDTYNRLQKRYGAVQGQEIYRKVRHVAKDIAENGPYPADKPMSAESTREWVKSQLVTRKLTPEKLPLSQPQYDKIVNMLVHAIGQESSKCCKIYMDQVNEAFKGMAKSKRQSIYDRTRVILDAAMEQADNGAGRKA